MQWPLSQKRCVFMPQWLPVSLAYLNCSWKWFSPAADQPLRRRKVGQNFDSDFWQWQWHFSSIYSRLGCKDFSSKTRMNTYQSILKQSILLSAFKGYLVECPLVTTNSTVNYHSNAWLPASCSTSVSILTGFWQKSVSMYLRALSFSLKTLHKTWLKKGTDQWHSPYEKYPSVTYFLYSLLLKAKRKNSHYTQLFGAQSVSQA